MRSFFLVLVVLGGCVADAEDPPFVTVPQDVDLQVVDHSDVTMDVCALAAELPADDICSLVCDPQAMAAQLVVEGSTGGTCYQLYCALPHDEHVLVGVCLP